MSRVSKAYVSGYTRTRIASVRLLPTEARSLVADFGAALEPEQEIVQARWQLDVSGTATLAAPVITLDGKQTSCTLTGFRWGCVACRCTVTLNDGGILTQLYAVEVADSNFVLDPIPGGGIDVTATVT